MGRLGILFYLVSFTPVFCQTYLVLSFSNRTASRDLDWTGESISESLGDALAAEDLLVVSREERDAALRRLSFRPDSRLTRASVIRVGMTLDAAVVVFGEVHGDSGNLRIVGHAIDLKKLDARGEMETTGSVEALSAMETHLAWQLLQQAVPGRTPPEQEYRGRRPVLRADALEQGARGWLAKAGEARIQHFTQAARLDPRYSAPAFELGKLYYERKQWQEAALWLGKLDGSAVRFREAMFYLGLARFHLDDFDAAAKAFEIVANSVPLSEVFNNLGASESRRGKADAIEHFRQAVEGDDADPAYHFNLGYALMKSGQFEAGAKEFRAVLDRSPNDAEAMQMLGRCLKAGGPPPPGLERLKAEYRESAYLQLKALLAPSKPQ